MARTTYNSTVVQPTISTSAYAAGDVVGGLLVLEMNATMGGLVNHITLVDAAGQDAALTLYLFDAPPTIIADQAAFNLSADDSLKRVVVVELDSYDSYHTAFVADVNNVFSGGTLYGYLVTNASTPTYSASDDLRLKVAVVAD